jgi:methionine synthase I (cobalamin-dependent)
MSATVPWQRLLDSARVLVADGAMGSLLIERGLGKGVCPELLNVERPELIAGVHSDYVAAGADIILTNTFGGTRVRLDEYDLGDRTVELNTAAVEIAAQVARSTERPVAVAGSIGPTGALLAPLGRLEPSAAERAYTEQAGALAAAGVDVLWIETMSSLEELEAAVAAANTTGVPVTATMSFGTHGRTMMGTSSADLAAWAADKPLSAVGANCGIGPEDVVAAVRSIGERLPQQVRIAKANCGLPVLVDGEVAYPLQPEDMEAYATAAMESGAGIVGACCGSSPNHIAAIRDVVNRWQNRDQVAPGALG